MDLRYWDANAFQGWLNQESDKVEPCRSVLDAAERGDVMIVTSALTLAEVLWIKGTPKLDSSKRDTVSSFFRNGYISVRGVDRFIAELARDVVWDNGVHPKDAIHI